MGCVNYISLLNDFLSEFYGPSVCSPKTTEQNIATKWNLCGLITILERTFFFETNFFVFGTPCLAVQRMEIGVQRMEKAVRSGPVRTKSIFFLEKHFFRRPSGRPSGRPGVRILGEFNTFTQLRYIHPSAQPPSQIMHAFPWLLFEPCMPAKWTDSKGQRGPRRRR